MELEAQSKQITTNRVISYHRKDQSVVLESKNGIQLIVEVISPTIFRIRYSPEKRFEEDFSYAIAKNNFPAVEIKVVVAGKYLSISTSALDCHIRLKDLTLKFFNGNGSLLNSDKKVAWTENVAFGGYNVSVTKAIRKGEAFFGLGDKPVAPRLNGKSFELWGTDSYGYQENSDPLYKNVPFYMSTHKNGCYGIFFDNTFRSFFDFGKKKKSLSSFGANGGEINYYFFGGESLSRVAEQYAILTGTPELPPLWALGYHQCKWSYFPEARVRKVTSKFRKLQIPCDAIYLDIDYMDGFRVFTWDKTRFPDPTKLISELSDSGFKTIVMIDPGIKIDEEYFVCKEGIERDYFCKRGDGPLAVGPVWPGYCYFPDFTNPEVRTWWAGFFEAFLKTGIKGVWTDMNEPALFLIDNFVQCERTLPDDVRHDFDGHPCSHRKAHNIYGMQMSKATYDGIRKTRPDERPFVITRSTYSGGQRYASVWTGDNMASWAHIKIANWQCQNLSVSGFSFCGSDIGGFINEPNGELYIRWLQLGIFHPFCRTHSSKDFGAQEPWSFGKKYTRLAKQTIELRYQLLAYIYSAFWHYSSFGTPMIKPVSWLCPDDEKALEQDEEFILGEHLLIKSVSRKKAKRVEVYLPAGRWYAWWNGKAYEGGRNVRVKTPLDRFPFFVKAGAVIPIRPVMQYVGEQPVEELGLSVYYGEGEHSTSFYEDSGQGLDYKKGLYNLKEFACTSTANYMVLSQIKTGKFIASYPTYALKVIGLPFSPGKVLIDDKETEFSSDRNHRKLTFKAGQAFKKIEILI